LSRQVCSIEIIDRPVYSVKGIGVILRTSEGSRRHAA
jgi:hypothetical protein